eukprot:2927267-Prymnesium_polylepis.1
MWGHAGSRGVAWGHVTSTLQASGSSRRVRRTLQSGFLLLRNCPTPDTQPPVPMPCTNTSTFPSVCA